MTRLHGVNDGHQRREKLDRKLSVIRGGLSRTATPELCLEREVREKVVALSVKDRGRSKGPRPFKHVMADVTHPLRLAARFARKLKARRVPFADQYDTVILPQVRYLYAINDRSDEFDTGEFRPAA